MKAALDDDDDESENETRWVVYDTSEWYEYHNLRTGNGRLMRLPDLRGQKEERYLIANRQANEARVAALPPQPEPDTRRIHAMPDESREIEADFARQFESSEVCRQREAYEAANPSLTRWHEQLDTIISFLKELHMPVPIEAGADWREAVRQASFALRKKMLLENLPLVCQAYCERLAMGIAQPSPDGLPFPNAHPPVERVDWYAKSILTGREWLGEPLDFDF